METENSRFLSAMLGCATGKDASHFTDKGSSGPESSGRIEKLAHLPAHVAVSCGGAEDNGICRGQVFHHTDRYMGKTFLGLKGAHFF